ncbi:hypothetical protein C8T65DRAFT_612296 [Cerioporus squamosus]|nr:hypothetical protein C8T65DRAFT_612296 [Cerioporus squamosus]
MFAYYSHADMCYAYLGDVPPARTVSSKTGTPYPRVRTTLQVDINFRPLRCNHSRASPCSSVRTRLPPQTLSPSPSGAPRWRSSGSECSRFACVRILYQNVPGASRRPGESQPACWSRDITAYPFSRRSAAP